MRRARRTPRLRLPRLLPENSSDSTRVLFPYPCPYPMTLGFGFTLHLRFPARLIFAPPALHRFRIVDNLAAGLRIELESALRLPGDVRQLEHCDGDVPHVDGRTQLLALGDPGNEVGEVPVRHRISPDQIGGRSLLFRYAELVGLVAA